MIQELKASYGHQFEEGLINEIAQCGTFKEVPAGHKLMEIGEYIKGMPLLISGVIKVLREDPDGDELLLYYLERGDTCSMTMSCCMGQSQSEIRAIAETDAKLIMIPIRKMEEWTAKYRSWRNSPSSTIAARSRCSSSSSPRWDTICRRRGSGPKKCSRM